MSLQAQISPDKSCEGDNFNSGGCTIGNGRKLLEESKDSVASLIKAGLKVETPDAHQSLSLAQRSDLQRNVGWRRACSDEKQAGKH
jgi:hypothetical protein